MVQADIKRQSVRLLTPFRIPFKSANDDPDFNTYAMECLEGERLNVTSNIRALNVTFQTSKK